MCSIAATSNLRDKLTPTVDLWGHLQISFFKNYSINLFKTNEQKLVNLNVHFNGSSWCTPSTFT